MTKAQSTRI